MAGSDMPSSNDVIGTMTGKDEENDRDQPQWEARFRSAFETAGHGMAIVGLDGRFIDINGMLTKILGYSETELRRRNFQSITFADDLDADLDHVKRLLSGESSSYEMEKRYIHKDGHTIWAQLNVGLIRGPDGQPRYFVSQIHDITERRRLEEVRRQSEAALAQAQKLAHLGYYRWSRSKQRLLSYNDEYLKILGLDPQSMAGNLSGMEPYLHPEDRERFTQTHRAAEAEGRGCNLQFRIVRPDGAVRYLLDLNEPDPGPDGSPDTWSGTVQDVTLQKQQAAALQDYQARLDLALRTARASYWELDLISYTYMADPEYFAILGYGADEVTLDKESWHALVHPDDVAKIDQAQVLPPNDHADHKVEYRVKAKSGEWRWLLSHFRACEFDNLGRPARLLGIDFDITEQRHREAELSEARARLAEAAHRAKIAFWRQSFGSGIYAWSEAADQILGRPKAELPATTEQYLELIHLEDLERVKAAYAEVRAQAKAYDLEYRILRSDGTLAWLNEIGEAEQEHADGSNSFAGTLQDITERKKLEMRLELLATVDELTGAHNRRSIMAQAEVELRRSRRFNHPLAFLFLDIDHFKRVNDRFGHKNGDLVLSTFSDICRNALRPSDVFARFGGEEFLVMLPETGLDPAIAVAQRLIAHVRETVFSINPPLRSLTTSAGVTAIRGVDDTIEAVLERIDKALYRAKELGRDRIESVA
jgi:diguanylate cyclase (GGDEF)-like protein/PAS domain S-box-containing protein